MKTNINVPRMSHIHMSINLCLSLSLTSTTPWASTVKSVWTVTIARQVSIRAALTRVSSVHVTDPEHQEPASKMTPWQQRDRWGLLWLIDVNIVCCLYEMSTLFFVLTSY